MSHSQHISDEVNAPYQMRDVIFWGCAAIIATTAAISSYAFQSDFEAPGLGAFNSSLESDGRVPFEKTASLKVNITNPKIDGDGAVDNFTTGSVAPKNVDKINSTATGSNSVSSFGMTVALKQSNADTIRRMKAEQDLKSANPPVVALNGSKIGSGPVGIDLGTGHSFSILGKRYSALKNAIPTLFANLSARASIVEHESSIEAHLVAGPLKDVEAAKLLCKKIQSRVNTICQPTKFTGRKLKLY